MRLLRATLFFVIVALCLAGKKVKAPQRTKQEIEKAARSRQQPRRSAAPVTLQNYNNELLKSAFVHNRGGPLRPSVSSPQGPAPLWAPLAREP